MKLLTQALIYRNHPKIFFLESCSALSELFQALLVFLIKNNTKVEGSKYWQIRSQTVVASVFYIC